MQINLTSSDSPYFLDLGNQFTQQLPLQDVKINCDTSAGPIVIALPLTSTLPFGNVRILVNDSGNAATNNITISASGGNTINNASSYVISTNKGFARIQVGAGTDYTAVSSISTPGGNDVIEIGKAEFLTLVSTGDLVFPAIYKITDVLEGLYVESFSGNTFNTQATLIGWSVNFRPSGNYKGVYHSTLGAVNPDEIYSWANTNYQNQTGAPMTPDIPNDEVFDTLDRFAALEINELNFYELCNLSVIINSDLDVCEAVLAKENGANSFTEVKTLLNDDVDLSVIPYFLNNYGTGNVNQLIINCRFDNDERYRNNVCNQFNTIGRLRIDFGESTIYNNVFDSNGVLYNLVTDGGTILILFCHFSNVESANNALTCTNFTATNAGTIELQSLTIDHNSYLNNIQADGVLLKIQDILMVNESCIDGLLAEAPATNFKIANGNWYNGRLKNYTYNSTSSDNVFTMSIQDVEIDGLVNRNLNNLNLYGKKGNFVIKHDFTTNPLLTTDPPLLYNFLPSGSWITNIKAVGDIDGASPAAELNIGMEGFPALITAVVGDFGSGETYDLISRQAPANRSLFLAATVDDITSGPITILVEFTL